MLTLNTALASDKHIYSKGLTVITTHLLLTITTLMSFQQPFIIRNEQCMHRECQEYLESLRTLSGKCVKGRHRMGPKSRLTGISVFKPNAGDE